MLKKANDFFMKHKLICGIGIGVLLFIFLIAGGLANRAERHAAEEEAEASSLVEETSTSTEVTNDSALMKMQERLNKKYGSLPEGYIWDADGTVISLGDKSLSAEEVVYSYLNGLRNLDISTAQKFSRKSQVVKRYSNYFDSKNKNTDYKEAFIRNMYREALSSMTVNGIESTSVFAQNKQVFSVSVNMLDLTSKEFWEKDIKEIYKNLNLYRRLESDTTKADMYLYDYVLSYYKSDNAAKRDVLIDLTVEKYPDIDSGWLVSIDTDIDDTSIYNDGNLVVSYIKERFSDEGKELLEEWAENGELDDLDSNSEDSNSEDTSSTPVDSKPEDNVSGSVE